MDFLLQLFDIERAAGTTAELWLDTTGLGLSVWGLLLLVLAALALPMYALVRAPRQQKVVLGLLRLGVVGLLALLFLKPSVVLLSPVQQKEKLAVLVDASRSMSIAPQAGAPTRWQAALDALGKGPLKLLAEQYDLELYSFGKGLSPQPGLEALSALSPVDEETDVGEALQQLTREGRDLAVGGLVLISDGIDRGPLRRAWREGGDSALKAGIEPLTLPVFTLTPGKDEGFVDLSIDELKYNEFAFLRQPFQVTATLRARGLENVETSVRLSSGGRPLGGRRVTLPADGKEVKVSFEINPDRVGKFTYTLETPVLPKEAVRENNRRSFTLKVVRDKIRVLQVAGAPSWDVKFLRRLLKSDPNIDLVSFFILRGPSDIGDFSQEEYSLIEFPYQDLFDRERDLGGFDLVIFQNFSYRPYLREQSGRLLNSLAEYVREGGGLAMLGGEQSFAAGEYGGTPLEDVLPVKMDVAPSVISRSVGLNITPQGLRHPVTVLHFDPGVNQKQWESLPALDGFNPTSPWSDAVVLATVAGSPQVPLLAVRKVGRGRTMALMTDTSWYWSFKAAGEGQGNLAYLRFWKNAMRWLVGDPDEGQLQVDTERENYRLGEPTSIQVKVVGADYGPVKDANVTLEVRYEEGNEKPAVFEGQTGPEGEWVQKFVAPKAGPYRVKATVAGSAQVRGSAETVFTVSEEGPEMKELGGDRGFLEAVARVTGGKDLTGQLQPQLSLKSRAETGLSQRTVVPLWDKLPAFGLLLSLLCVEWLLRRRWGLR